ncbi:MAG: hypothetical protein HXN07_05370 [Porphyromonadaceae bacterium]|nr:hypothetical protein [Porphyromonadaceae bacterium]
MKKIIALYGSGGKGKTKTLNLLIKLLSGLERHGDGQVLISHRDKDVAITTGGDTKEVVEENIDFFVKQAADILVTATRTKGDTKKVLKQYAKTDIIWIGKNYSDSLHDLINEAQAKELHAFIDLLIDNWDSEPKK